MPEIAVFETHPAAPAPPQAHSDAQLLEIWLHGRPAHTQRLCQAISPGSAPPPGNPCWPSDIASATCPSTSAAPCGCPPCAVAWPNASCPRPTVHRILSLEPNERNRALFRPPDPEEKDL